MMKGSRDPLCILLIPLLFATVIAGSGTKQMSATVQRLSKQSAAGDLLIAIMGGYLHNAPPRKALTEATRAKQHSAGCFSRINLLKSDKIRSFIL